MSSPKLIGFVGHPTHGKSTALEMFKAGFPDVEVMDTGRKLREACMELYNLTWEDVSTQAGKLKMVHRPEYGDTVEIRQALGDYGKLFEEEEPGYWTRITVDEAETLGGEFHAIGFDSIRREQGKVIRDRGGIVIEIFDPRKPLSPYDFDQVDQRYVDFRIVNNGSLEDFRRKVEWLIESYLWNGKQMLAA